MNICIYSHTHWDREWYLSQTQFQYRLIRTVDEIIDLLRADNDFRTFVLDGQTSIIEDYLELRPEREPVLAELIAAGHIVIGPWFTMPDMFLPDGESLIRNLARGYEDCCRWKTAFPNVGYVPDSFGHIEQVPQILRGFGIDNFIFSRGRPVELSGEDEKREFLWQAPDGSTVIAWQLPGSYMADAFLPSATDLPALRTWIEQRISQFASSHRPDIVLICHGVDHCWLQRDIPDIAAAVQALFPAADVHHGSIQDALDLWKQETSSDLSHYQGQLRGHLNMHELHGTLSSRIDNKVMNEQAQMFLENLAEPLDAIAGHAGKPAAPWFFKKAWRFMFHNHAHDSICGCSQDRVHDDVNRRFREAIELAIDIADSALDYLNNDARRTGVPTAIVYAGLNGGNQVVDIVVRMPSRPTHGAECLEDADGNCYPLQVETADELVVTHTNKTINCFEWRGCAYIDDLTPAEIRRLRFTKRASQTMVKNSVIASETSLDNGLIRLDINPDGSVNLQNHETGRVFKNLHVLAHDTDIGGGYHYEPLPRSRRRTSADGTAQVRLITRGSLRSTLEIETFLKVPHRYNRTTARLEGQRTIRCRSTFTLDAGSRFVRVRTDITNNAANHRLRLLLPTGMATEEVTADAAFALHTNRIDKWPADPGQNFHPMRNMVAIEENADGLFFAGKGLHEYEISSANSGRQLEITMLRSVDLVLQCCTWQTPGATLQKPLQFEYALGTYSGNWRSACLPAQVAAFRNPAIANVNGDTNYEGETERHATVGFYIRNGSRLVPTDSNRSAWKPYNAERDGWRRIEEERFVHGDLPTRIHPFKVLGHHLTVSAFKRATNGRGCILRLWSWHETAQQITVYGHQETSEFHETNLLEHDMDKTGRGSLQLTINPFEIKSVRITLASAD